MMMKLKKQYRVLRVSNVALLYTQVSETVLGIVA